jgi:uncharacterized protein YbjQ (UPF0145 family)
MPSYESKPADKQMLICSTNDIPGKWIPENASSDRQTHSPTPGGTAGYEIVETFGHVFGVIVRSRNLGANVGAGLKSIIGGELGALTSNLERSREMAVDRMVGQTYANGGNAVVAFRFDTTTNAGNANEVCAYGTAVRIRPRNQGPSKA